MNKPSVDQALLCAYIDIKHVLQALNDGDPYVIEVSALKDTLSDVKDAYTGSVELLNYKGDNG